MTAVVHDLRPALSASSKGYRRTGPRLRPRDLVTWTNPNTGQVWGDLVVEFVYGQSGTALVRGWFGRLSRKTGDCHIESMVVRACDVVVSGNAAEVAS